jgi:hypothetical protein
VNGRAFDIIFERDSERCSPAQQGLRRIDQRLRLPISRMRRTTMSCCGRQREQFLGASQVPPRVNDKLRQPLSQPAIRFEYVGATGLTILGAVTGKRYRFDKPGSRLLVDLRDVASMASVPHLRRV